jgi:hypothetical protein
VQQEEQLVTVKQCSLVNNVCQQPPAFSLNYNGDITESLSPRSSAANLRTALNSLPSISSAGSVQVTLESSDSQARVYRVKFNFAEPETTVMLRDGSQLRGQFVNVAVDKAGINSDRGFRLNIGGKRTQVITPNATEEELKSIFSQLFTTECSFSTDTGKNTMIFFRVQQCSKRNKYVIVIYSSFFFQDSAYFYQGYEGEAQGYEQGDRVKDQTTYCGRQVLTDPNAIYVAGLTVIKPDGTKGGEFNLQQYSRVCFE